MFYRISDKMDVPGKPDRITGKRLCRTAYTVDLTPRKKEKGKRKKEKDGKGFVGSSQGF